jgi:hypothetical protein
MTGIGTEDVTIVQYCQQHNLPLLTVDWRLPDSQTSLLSNENPGVVVVRNDSRRTITTAIIMAVLGEFKSRLADWHTLEIRNSILELWPDGVLVRTASTSGVEDTYLKFADAAWQKRFVGIIKANGSLP